MVSECHLNLNQQLKSIFEHVLYTQLKANDTLIVTDSELGSISQITLDEKLGEAPSKIKKRLIRKLFRKEHQAIKDFLNIPPSQKPSAIALHRILNSLRQHQAGKNHHLILIGSPVWKDQNPRYSMNNGYLSDGHIMDDSGSVFATKRWKDSLSGVSVHWFYSPLTTAWSIYEPDQHRVALHRFYTLYLQAQGAALNTFTHDIKLINRIGVSATITNSSFVLNPDDSKVQVHQYQPFPKDLFETTANASSSALAHQGLLTIGIKWSCQHCDLDLYVQNQNHKELFYGQPQTQEGRHTKDFLDSPKNGYETVAFNRPVSIRDIKVFINHYSGVSTQPINGEVRIQYDGTVYAFPFKLHSSNGDRGKSHRGSGTWLRVNLFESLSAD